MAAHQWRLLAILASVSAAYPPWHTFQGQNAVSHCPSTCITRAPFLCLGLFPGASDRCAAACIAAKNCSQWTWADDDGRCFTRTDGAWSLVPGSTIAACNNDTVRGCAVAPPRNNTRIVASVSSSPVGHVHPLSPAVTLDGWNISSPGVGPKWGPSSFLALNLSHPLLLALATQIAPGLLRLGGSPEDSIVFDADGTCVAGTGGGGPAPGYYCSQTHPYIYGCLTAPRWEEILAFASVTGLRLILGLNGCYGRTSPSSPMDTSNARALFEATAASPHAHVVYGFELSNEVVGEGARDTILPSTYGADVFALRNMAASIFAARGLPPPMFAGPDVASPETLATVLGNSSGALSATTYHHYPGCTQGEFFFILEPSCLAIIDAWGVLFSAPARPYAGVATWAGETALHGGGGVANLTDSFTSTLYYAYQLGALPALGVELSARQALVGGDYELLQRVTMRPNPDYALLWLFKRLVGGGADAFAVDVDVNASATGVRVFAFRASAARGGGLVILALSLNSVGAHALVDVAWAAAAGGGGGARTEWHLTGQVGVGGAPLVCNGRVVLIPDAAGVMPDAGAMGVRVAGGPVDVGGASVAFVVYG